jgi:chromosome segregation ATPase
VSKSVLERKLSEITFRLRALRDEIAVAQEQLHALAEDADDSRLKALVSETPLAEHEHAEAQKHADAMQRHLGALVAELDGLERAQDDLLDRLIAQSR